MNTPNTRRLAAPALAATMSRRHRTPLIPMVGLVALLISGLGPGSAFAAYPGATGKIAYEANDGVDSEIFVMNTDGSAQTNITNDSDPPANDADPAWSPNGAKIAVARAAEGHTNIFVMNADGTGRVNLTPGPEVTGQANGGIEPTWSPDGTKIAWNHSGDIWVMDAASGAGKTKLDFGPGLEQWPAWSPDGTKIAFTRSANIWVGDAGGDLTPTQLTSIFGAEVDADWSPDGARITFTTSDVWVMNADGSGQTNLTPGAGPSTGILAAWSPDNKKLAFGSAGFGAPNGYDIFTMNTDGTGVTPMNTAVATTDLDPDWQPLRAFDLYARPGSATPLRVPLVLAYQQCTSANSTHAPPLNDPSCAPPVRESSLLTMGTGGVGSAFARFNVQAGNPMSPPDEADLNIVVSASDVRRVSDGTDYTGQVIFETQMRITDGANGYGDVSSTVSDARFGFPITCVNNGGAGGGTCTITTTADTLVPGFAKEGKRAVISALRVSLLDAGADGSITPGSGSGPLTCGSGDEATYLRQGIFTP